MVHEWYTRLVHEYVTVHELCTRVCSGARVVHEITVRCTSAKWCTSMSGARVGVVAEIAARVRVVHEST